MDKDEIIKLIDSRIQLNAQNSKYSVAKTPAHIHNNIDSPNIPAKNIVGFQILPAVDGGVLDPSLLNGQYYNVIINSVNQPVTPTAVEFPITIIYGFGTTDNSYTLLHDLAGAQSLTLTGSLSAGATSATLTGNWTFASGIEQVTFSNGNVRAVTFTNGSAAISWTGGLSSTATTAISTAGATTGTLTGNFLGTTAQLAAQFDTGEVRIVQFTNGSAAISWTQPLQASTATTAILIIANARFHGGTSAYGTVVFFRNDDDGIAQIWVRSAPGLNLWSWAGFDFDETVYT